MRRDVLKFISIVLLLNFSALFIQIANKLISGAELSEVFYPSTDSYLLDLWFMLPVIIFITVWMTVRLKLKYGNANGSWIFPMTMLGLGVFTFFTNSLSWFSDQNFSGLEGVLTTFFSSTILVFGLLIIVVISGKKASEKYIKI